VDLGKVIASWPVVRQAAGDPLGLGKAVRSPRTRELRPRIAEADVVHSVCPYCAVGCGQLVYVKNGAVTQIEGDPASPISRGRLCPKGSASKQLVTSDLRQYRVKYRRPYSPRWESLPLEDAMDMIADRVIRAREETCEAMDDEGRTLNRTLGIGSLGGATIDNEENYLIKKLFTALGVVGVENQARI
jgi:formate dehydrogenase major subunit